MLHERDAVNALARRETLGEQFLREARERGADQETIALFEGLVAGQRQDKTSPIDPFAKTVSTGPGGKIDPDVVVRNALNATTPTQTTSTHLLK